MSKPILPTKETEIPGWLNAFVTVATANATMVALPTTTLTNLSNLRSTLMTQQDTVRLAHQAAKGATQAKKVTLRQIQVAVTSANRQVQANLNVTPQVKDAMGLTPTYAPPAPVMPTAPIHLSASGFSTGIADLIWKRNGNKTGTVYLVYAKRGTEPDFTIIGSTNATKFTDENAKPGVQTIYKVLAQRVDRVSGFSNEAILYPVAPVLTMVDTAQAA